ncbi:efflux transporter outer membrane subunit [soil metagenome]
MNRTPKWLLAVLATALLAACADMGNLAKPQPMLDAAGVGANGASQAFIWPNDRWWAGFGDSQRDSLVDRALGGSPDLATAAARLARANAESAYARGDTGPTIDGTLSSKRQRYSQTDIFPPPIGGRTVWANSIGLSGSYEIDFFGRQQAALDRALGNERAASAQLQATRVLLAARVASEYFALARLVEQRDIAIATRDQRDQIRVLVNDRVSAGLDTNVELRQAEGSVPEVSQELELIEENMSLARHRLAIVAGVPIDSFATLTPRLSAARPLAMPETIPADLLGRRADISAARARVEASQAGVTEAKARFYPNIDLQAMVGLGAVGFPNWLEAGSRQYAIGPAITLPIFESGRLRANLRGAAADVDEAVASYNQTLLSAVGEVADVATSMRFIERQAVQQRAAQAAAESAYDLSIQRYRAGLGTFLTVLTAQNNVFVQRRSATDLSARALDAQVTLMRALGGGYIAANAQEQKS